MADSRLNATCELGSITTVGGIVFHFKKRHIPFQVLPDSVSPLTLSIFRFQIFFMVYNYIHKCKNVLF